MSATTIAELGSLPLFDGCPEGDLRGVLDALSGLRHVAEGEAICVEGDRADRWWIVIEGVADVTIAGLYTATIGPGETIGELALLDGQPRAATVTAVTAMELHEVAGDRFLDAVAASPHLSLALLRQLARRLRETSRRRPPPSRRIAVSVTRSPTPSAGPDRRLQFDPMTPGFFEDPSAHLAALRESAAVHWSDALGSHVVTRYEDVHLLARSRSLGSVATLEAPAAVPEDGSTLRPSPGYRMMIRKDGDDHLRLRRLMARVFTPRAVSQWRERAETIVERLLAAAEQRSDIDVIANYALPLPAQVISDMLGMPQRDAQQLRDWSRILTLGLEPITTPEEKERVTEAGRAMDAYLVEVIRDKRNSSSNDILTALLHVEDADGALCDKDVRAQVLMLYIAGHETTLNLIGNGVTHLLRLPDQLERLRAEPALDANAVEEVLRFDSPAQLTRRINLIPVEIGGLTIEPGSHLTLSLASANRDPRKWGADSDVLDIGRPGAHEHVSFGAGPHYCLGASLARLEATIALPRLLRRFPKLTAAYDKPPWISRITLRGVESLPVTLR